MIQQTRIQRSHLLYQNYIVHLSHRYQIQSLENFQHELRHFFNTYSLILFKQT